MWRGFTFNFVRIFGVSKFRELVWMSTKLVTKTAKFDRISKLNKLFKAKKCVIHCIHLNSLLNSHERHKWIHAKLREKERFVESFIRFDVQSIKLTPIFLWILCLYKYHIDQTKYSEYFTLLLHSIVSVLAAVCAVYDQTNHHLGCRMRQLFFIMMTIFQLELLCVFFCFCILSNWTVNYLIRNNSCKYKWILMCGCAFKLSE